MSSNPLARKPSVAVRQLRLEWSDLGCAYGSAGGSGTKVVLSGVSGAVLPGEMAALMGPSGAGKSTVRGAGGGREGWEGTVYTWLAVSKRQPWVPGVGGGAQWNMLSAGRQQGEEGGGG